MKISCVSAVSAAILAGLPFVALLPGCGGGNSNNPFSPHPTSSPTATPTPVATPLLAGARIDLGNAQTGFLSASRVGNAVTGTLTIGATQRLVAARRAQTVFFVPVGGYSVTGNFTAPRGLTLRGNFPAPTGAFSLVIEIPTTTEDGKYTITVGGQSNSGTLPKTGGTVIPTPTPTPDATATPTPNGTPTPTPTPGQLSGSTDLTFSNVTGTTTDTSPFKGSLVVNSNYQNSGFINFFFDIREGDGGPTRRFNARLGNFPFKTTPIAQGDTFTASSSDANATFYRANGSDAEWKSNSGTILLQKVQGNSFTFLYQKVHFVANSNGATGAFDLSGTITINNPTKFG